MKINQLVNEKSDDNEVVVLENGRAIDLFKEATVIIDFLNFDCNSRVIISTLYKYYENNIEFMDFENDLNYALQQLNNKYIDDILETDLPITYDNTNTFINYLKLINLKIDSKNINSSLDKLFLIIDIINELNINRVLFFVGVLDYLDSADIEELFKYILYKKQKVLFIQRTQVDNIKGYNEYTIDDDFSEIMEKL